MNMIDCLMDEFQAEMSKKNVGELNTAMVILQSQYNNCLMVKSGLIQSHKIEEDEDKKKEIATLVLKFLGKMESIEQKVFWLKERMAFLQLPAPDSLPS